MSGALLAIALAGAPPAVQQRPAEPPSFGVSVESVYVDVFVSRGDEAVGGLTAENFELKDNGVRQRVRLVDVGTLTLSAVLALDVSQSVAGEKLRLLRAATDAFLDRLEPRDEAALLLFNHRVERAVFATTDRFPLRAALRRVEASGSTALFDALFAALLQPKGKARRLVIVFSDGADTQSWLSAAELERVALEQGAIVHFVWDAPLVEFAPRVIGRGLPSPPREDPVAYELRRIAEATGGGLWEASRDGGLARAFERIMDVIKTRYVLAYEPEGVEREGWHELELRLKRAKGRVRARRGYRVAP